MKMLKFGIISFLVGVLVNLLGFPIIVAGSLSIKACIIIGLFDTIFAMMYWNTEN